MSLGPVEPCRLTPALAEIRLLPNGGYVAEDVVTGSVVVVVGIVVVVVVEPCICSH